MAPFKLWIALLGGLASSGAAAADYPAKPVKIVAAYAAGGGGDILTRVVAAKMAARWRQSVLVENRPGAGTTLATAAVAQAQPDGYTLLMNGNTMLVSSATYPKLSYDVARDLAPITIIAASPFLVTARADLGVETLQQLAAQARRSPGKLNYGSSGSGTFAHLALERMKQIAGIEITHVPYKGSAFALTGLLAGEIDFIMQTPPALLPHLASGKLRALAVAAPRRLAALPAVPTTEEAGLKGLDVTIWYGLFAPRGTPEAAVREVREAVVEALKDEEVARRLAPEGMIADGNTPEQFAARIAVELPMWTEVVRRAKLKPE